MINFDCIIPPYFSENAFIYNALQRLDRFPFDEKTTFLTAIRVILKEDQNAIYSLYKVRRVPFRIDSIMSAYRKKLYSTISLHRELQLYSKDIKEVKKKYQELVNELPLTENAKKDLNIKISDFLFSFVADNCVVNVTQFAQKAIATLPIVRKYFSIQIPNSHDSISPTTTTEEIRKRFTLVISLIWEKVVKIVEEMAISEALAIKWRGFKDLTTKEKIDISLKIESRITALYKEKWEIDPYSESKIKAYLFKFSSLMEKKFEADLLENLQELSLVSL